MRDRVPILAGLIVFVALFTFPMWRDAMARAAARQPELRLPIQQKQCVAPRDYMRRAHMQLLASWREGAVRRGELTYLSHDGRNYAVSMSRTCLGQCHTNKQEFCDRCHQYAGVSGPYCFDCHVDSTAKTAVLPESHAAIIAARSAQ